MYHCDERYGYGRRDGYDRSRYDNHYDNRYDNRYGRDRYSGDAGCWSHDRWGWHRCRSGYGYRYGYGSSGGDPYYQGQGWYETHASGGYDSHRSHPR
jgi:hypothetical protein